MKTQTLKTRNLKRIKNQMAVTNAREVVKISEHTFLSEYHKSILLKDIKSQGFADILINGKLAFLVPNNF